MPTPSPSSDRVFIRDLILEMSAGIYDHEKANTQRVIVNITLDVESNFGRDLASIDNVVSYEDIVNAVSDTAQSKHYDLLEEFAENIAQMCLEDSRVSCVNIMLEKPDIIDKTKSVGVEITRN